MDFPMRHSCGKKYKRADVPVDPRVFSSDTCPVNYCSECNIYNYNKKEFGDPSQTGEYITKLQRKTNMSSNKSPFTGKRTPFSMSFLEKLRRD